MKHQLLCGKPDCLASACTIARLKQRVEDLEAFIQGGLRDKLDPKLMAENEKALREVWGKSID